MNVVGNALFMRFTTVYNQFERGFYKSGSGDDMGLVTIRQFAESQKVSYEAVRKQIVRYEMELSGHIIKDGNTQYLDDKAVEFLKEKRLKQPVILLNADQEEEIRSLKEKLSAALEKITTFQEELLKEKDRVITLQEDAIKYAGLLEDNRKKEEELRTVREEIGSLHKEQELIQKEQEELRKENESLRNEKEAAEAEAKSYSKSIFGFYRKKKGGDD